MGTVTYPNLEVEQYITQNFIPVQFNVQEQPGKMDEFNAVWTPALMVQDADGREHRRSFGYLDPERFLAEMSLARVQAALDRHEFAEAQKLADEALQKCSGDPVHEPEARYWASVAAYKATNDSSKLMDGWNKLLDQFPDSEWAHRAEFIRA